MAINDWRHLQASAIYGGLDDKGGIEGGKTSGEGVTAVVRLVLGQHMGAINLLIAQTQCQVSGRINTKTTEQQGQQQKQPEAITATFIVGFFWWHVHGFNWLPRSGWPRQHSGGVHSGTCCLRLVCC